MANKTLKIGWLYPELMSTYGDRGNIIVLSKRAQWRDINVETERISIGENTSLLASCNLIFMGGAQDTQQEIVNDDLFKITGKILKEKIESGTPGLYICGAYQFLGRYYKTADGKKLPGLGIFPAYTENPREKKERLIGNTLIENDGHLIVGFENHGGRTYLEDSSMAFGKVINGYGNNGKDKTEGIRYKNSIGTYLHGPILPKNPTLADFLIEKAMGFSIKPLEDSLENRAREAIISKL